MSQSNHGFFVAEQDKNNSGNSNENIINSFLSSLKCPSDFAQNQNKKKDNKMSVITVNWEKEVDNVFMDEIGKFSKQCN